MGPGGTQQFSIHPPCGETFLGFVELVFFAGRTNGLSRGLGYDEGDFFFFEKGTFLRGSIACSFIPFFSNLKARDGPRGRRREKGIELASLQRGSAWGKDSGRGSIFGGGDAGQRGWNGAREK